MKKQKSDCNYKSLDLQYMTVSRVEMGATPGCAKVLLVMWSGHGHLKSVVPDSPCRR